YVAAISAALREARPRPVLSTGHDSRSKRVLLHIAADREEVPIGLDGEGLESSLIDRPSSGGAARGVPPLAVRAAKPMHEPRKLALLARPQHQMEVIRHQAVRKDSQFDALARTGQHAQTVAIIAVLLKEP